MEGREAVLAGLAHEPQTHVSVLASVSWATDLLHWSVQCFIHRGCRPLSVVPRSFSVAVALGSFSMSSVVEARASGVFSHTEEVSPERA